MALTGGAGVSAGRGVVSPTPSVYGPSSLGTGSAEGVGALAGALCAVVEGAGVTNTTLAPSKKPSMGTPMEAKIFSAVGRYMDRGSGSS